MKFILNNNNIIHFNKVESTNDMAEKILIEKKPDEFTVITTDFQLKGRGVGKNMWESEPSKNILMSMILYPHFLDPANQFMLNKVASLAVSDTLEEMLNRADIKIKWPNDVYVENKKIAGILSKNMITGNEFSSCIVGIGLNVNQVQFSSHLPDPVSMARISCSVFDRNQVLIHLMNRIYDYYQKLKSADYEQIDNKYLSLLLNYQSPALFQSGKEVFEGIIIGVDSFGLLMVNVGNEIRKFNMKEIKLLTKSTNHENC